MSFNERRRPGHFCWADLGTDDFDAAAAFYGGLFEWECVDMPGPGRYAIARLDGRDVAAVYERGETDPGSGPSRWLPYLRVEDCAAKVAELEKAGGAVHTPPHEIPGTGEMAIVADPEGALFALWEPRGHEGYALVDEPGSVTWHELSARDVEGTPRFYAGLFGWQYVTQPTSRGRYTMFEHEGTPVAGMLQLEGPEGGAPASWTTYFEVADCDEAARRVAELGGRLISGPTDLPIGRYAVVADVGGAAFAVFQEKSAGA